MRLFIPGYPPNIEKNLFTIHIYLCSYFNHLRVVLHKQPHHVTIVYLKFYHCVGPNVSHIAWNAQLLLVFLSWYKRPYEMAKSSHNSKQTALKKGRSLARFSTKIGVLLYL